MLVTTANYKMAKPRKRQSQKAVFIVAHNTEAFVELRFSLQGL
jgi:hypothetical protein